MTNLTINDKFQNYINGKFTEKDLKSVEIFNDVIFYGIFVYYYYFGNPEKYIIILKYISVFLVTRFILGNLTTTTTTVDNKQYFTLNSKLAIFTIIIIFILELNSKIAFIFIVLYALFNIAIKYTTTTDSIFTVLSIYGLFKLNLI